MSTMPDASVFNLHNLTIDDLNNIKLEDIKDVSKDWNYGRRFTLNIKDQNLHTNPLVFKDIFEKVKEISRNERKACELDNLKIVSEFLVILKEADKTANETYEERAKKDLGYRIRTVFRRLIDIFSASHSKKIESELKKIEKLYFHEKDFFYVSKVNDSIANKDPKNAEEALSKLFLGSDASAGFLKQIMELYFEKGDSASLLAAFGIIRKISGALAGGPNEGTFDRVDASMKVLNGLLEKNNDMDLIEAAKILRQFGWRDVEVKVRETIMFKVVVRLIEMAENGDLSGLDLADKIALHSGHYGVLSQRINELRSS